MAGHLAFLMAWISRMTALSGFLMQALALVMMMCWIVSSRRRILRGRPVIGRTPAFSPRRWMVFFAEGVAFVPEEQYILGQRQGLGPFTGSG